MYKKIILVLLFTMLLSSFTFADNTKNIIISEDELIELNNRIENYTEGETISRLRTIGTVNHSDSEIGRISFWNGDIILGHDHVDDTKELSLQGYYNHASMFITAEDKFISAWPGEGIRRETWDFWKESYFEVTSLYVHSATSTERDAAVTFAINEGEEPNFYDVLSVKSDYYRWYCSKIPWAAYKESADIDLDFDYGIWVYPVDLSNDGDTTVFANSDKTP